MNDWGKQTLEKLEILYDCNVYFPDKRDLKLEIVTIWVYS